MISCSNNLRLVDSKHKPLNQNQHIHRQQIAQIPQELKRSFHLLKGQKECHRKWHQSFQSLIHLKWTGKLQVLMHKGKRSNIQLLIQPLSNSLIRISRLIGLISIICKILLDFRHINKRRVILTHARQVDSQIIAQTTN